MADHHGGVPNENRYTESSPCPICGGWESMARGEGSRCDGFRSGYKTDIAFCRRVESAGAEGSGLFKHRTKGNCGCGTEHTENPTPSPKKRRRVVRRKKSLGSRKRTGEREKPGGSRSKKKKKRIVRRKNATVDAGVDLGNPSTIYDYCDADGEVLFQVLRWDLEGGGKTFRQGRREGKRWAWNVPRELRIPYRLDRVHEAIARGETVYVVEGEKCVHAVEEMGGIATTNPGGAGMGWPDGFSEELRGAEVILWPDWDPEKPDCPAESFKGQRHIVNVLASLKRVDPKATVRVVRSAAGLNDAADHHEAGHAIDDAVRVDPGELLAFASSRGGGATGPTDERRTDTANAERLAAGAGDRLRWVRERKTWFEYREGLWQPGGETTVVKTMQEIARELRGEAERGDNKSQREELWKAANRAESARGIKDAEWVARSLLEVRIAELDQGDMLLNCENGTLDLERMEFRPHRPEDLMTRRTNARYRKGASSKIWTRLIEQALPDEEVQAFFLRCLGASITGRQVKNFLYVYGPPDSGKTTVLEAVSRALGSYAMTTDPRTFLKKRFESGNTPELARLPGARMVLANEVPPGVVFESALIKRWTGGDMIEAMAKYGDPFTFRPQGTLVFVGNVRPGIDYHEKAMWQRVVLLPFEQSIPPNKQDRELAEKLRSPKCMAAILADAVEGFLDLQERGWRLDPPRSVTKAIAEYQQENDPIGGFLDEHCVVEDDAWASFDDLKGVYEVWAEDEGIKALSRNQLGREFTARGFKEHRKRVNGRQSRGRLGIRLRRDRG